jgi:alkanesulfonate monooxygenase SsuD/methylene tetrahydromethanopterin reductase-like flavin-dependent oxidoreductase (luciferase family)
VRQMMEAHRKACAQRSNPIPKVINEAFAGVAIMHVAENKEEEAIGLDGARWFLHNVAKLFEPLMAKNKLYSYEYLRNVFAMDIDPKDASDAQLREHHMVVVGNPDEVINKLENFRKAGLSQVICFKQAGRIPHANIMQSIKRIGKYILPHFNPQRSVPVEEPLFPVTTTHA